MHMGPWIWILYADSLNSILLGVFTSVDTCFIYTGVSSEIRHEPKHTAGPRCCMTSSFACSQTLIGPAAADFVFWFLIAVLSDRYNDELYLDVYCNCRVWFIM